MSIKIHACYPAGLVRLETELKAVSFKELLKIASQITASGIGRRLFHQYVKDSGHKWKVSQDPYFKDRYILFRETKLSKEKEALLKAELAFHQQRALEITQFLITPTVEDFIPVTGLRHEIGKETGKNAITSLEEATKENPSVVETPDEMDPSYVLGQLFGPKEESET